ncbi:MAG: alpha-mannosidase [Actinobacteria bacterium]|nr:alpha-mannosidase [Actinomycetota bacterium]
MRWAAITAAMLCILLTADGGLGARPQTVAPDARVGIFYYAWYGTPNVDGTWLHWGQGEHAPPASIGSRFYPARGVYSSGDRAVVRAQMREIADMRVDTVIVSWWGPGSVEDARLRPVAAAASAVGLDVALHVEPWDRRTPASVVEALENVRDLGIDDVYVYDSGRDGDEDWRAALENLDDLRVFAHTSLPGKALRGGFDGLYTYDVLVHNGNGFARMCASAQRLGLACAPSVGPGFDATRATADLRVQQRKDGRRYDHMWDAAVRARPDVVTITSYNEWHEGTQIEPVRAVPGPYATYDGAWGRRGLRAQRAYLDRTAYWIERLHAYR